MCFYVDTPLSIDNNLDGLSVIVFYVEEPGKYYPKFKQRYDVICFKNIPDIQFYMHMKKLWKNVFPYSVCLFGCKQAVFSIHKIRSSYHYPAQFQENIGNDVGFYEIKIKSRIIYFYVTNYTRSSSYGKEEEINVKTVTYRSLHAYTIGTLMRSSREGSDYQILIGGMKMHADDLPQKCLVHVGGTIQPSNASIMYGSQRMFKLKFTEFKTVTGKLKNYHCSAYKIQFTQLHNDLIRNNSYNQMIRCINKCIQLCEHLIEVKEREQCYNSILLFFATFLWIFYLFKNFHPVTLSTYLIAILFFIIPFIFYHFTYKKVQKYNKPFEDAKAKLISDLTQFR